MLHRQQMDGVPCQFSSCVSQALTLWMYHRAAAVRSAADMKNCSLALPDVTCAHTPALSQSTPSTLQFVHSQATIACNRPPVAGCSTPAHVQNRNTNRQTTQSRTSRAAQQMLLQRATGLQLLCWSFKPQRRKAYWRGLACKARTAAQHVTQLAHQSASSHPQ
jgi:hypothetical protein